MQHHERVDGSGYPLGVKEDDICEGAKLFSILDIFEAITHA
jgi:HD-GYP domain-containing protein (c-di-GMP phosphodiesterase class II)